MDAKSGGTLAQMTREWSSCPQTHRSPGTLLFASWDSGAPWRGHSGRGERVSRGGHGSGVGTCPVEPETSGRAGCSSVLGSTAQTPWVSFVTHAGLWGGGHSLPAALPAPLPPSTLKAPPPEASEFPKGGGWCSCRASPPPASCPPQQSRLDLRDPSTRLSAEMFQKLQRLGCKNLNNLRSPSPGHLPACCSIRQ